MNTTTNAPLASIPTTLSDDDLGELVDYCDGGRGPVWEILRDLIEWHNMHCGQGPNGVTLERLVSEEDPDTYVVECFAGNGLVVRSLRNDTKDLLCDEDLEPTLLCGSMFSLDVRRHRLFEASFPIDQPPCWHASQPHPVGVYGHSGGRSNRDGLTFSTKEVWQKAMGIDWMTNAEMAQAIPPAYTKHIVASWMDRP